MKWGKRKSTQSNTKKTKQSSFSKSLEQKYGHKTVSDLVNSAKPKTIKIVKTVIRGYAAYKVTELLVGAIPRVAWATGKIISTSPLR